MKIDIKCFQRSELSPKLHLTLNKLGFHCLDLLGCLKFDMFNVGKVHLYHCEAVPKVPKLQASV
jgi:hypothetical protein